MFRRRREKLQAHLKESRSLKNYTTSSHNALEAKMRASNTNLQIHEVSTWDVFSLLFFGAYTCKHMENWPHAELPVLLFCEDRWLVFTCALQPGIFL